MGARHSKWRACEDCGRWKRCNGSVCAGCRTRSRCNACGRQKPGRQGWCNACLAIKARMTGVNYGGDLRPAADREAAIRLYEQRAAAQLPLFGGEADA